MGKNQIEIDSDSIRMIQEIVSDGKTAIIRKKGDGIVIQEEVRKQKYSTLLEWPSK